MFLTVRLCPPRSSKWGSSDFSQHIWLLLDGSFLTPAPYSLGLTLVQRLGLGNRQHRQKRSRSGPSPTHREKRQLVALIPGDGLGGGDVTGPSRLRTHPLARGKGGRGALT